MKLTLFDIQPRLVEAWQKEFGDEYTEVNVIESSLDELSDHDCLVSPGNSFGLMDGGIDRAIAELLPNVQRNVSWEIGQKFYGEQPVGTSLIVPTGDEHFIHLAHTPTMRFPRPIQAEAVYDATRALFIAIADHNDASEFDPEYPILTVACPGLGTASGAIGPITGARMMRLAYDSVFKRPADSYSNWAEVDEHLHQLYKMGESM